MLEELQSITSIYGPEMSTISENNRSYAIEIKSDLSSKLPNKITLNFELVDGYPERTPLIYQYSIYAPWLQRKAHAELIQRLDEVFHANAGSPIIFSLVESIRDFIDESSDNNDIGDTKDIVDDLSEMFAGEQMQIQNGSVVSIPSVKAHLTIAPEFLPMAKNTICPPIHGGSTVTDRKSVFQAHCSSVTSLGEVSAFITTLLQTRKIAQATHNILAWCVGKSKSHPTLDGAIASSDHCYLSDSDDDGETHAGDKLLRFLEISNAENIVVMVSRWYGGVHLGPDRFKHINNVAKELLMEHGHLRTNITKVKDKKKKSK